MVDVALRLKSLEALAFVFVAAILSAVFNGMGNLFLVAILPIVAVAMLYLVYLYLPVQVGCAWLLRTKPRLLVVVLTGIGAGHTFLVASVLFANDPTHLRQAVIFILLAAPIALVINIAIAGWAMQSRRPQSRAPEAVGGV